MGPQTRVWRNFDFVMFGVTLMLIIYGVLMISSATTGAVDTDLISRVPRQIQYAMFGVVVLFAVAAVDYRLFGALQPYIYGLLVFLLRPGGGLSASGGRGGRAALADGGPAVAAFRIGQGAAS